MANTMQALDGKLVNIAERQAVHSERLDNVGDAVDEASAERKRLDERLQVLEGIVKIGKGSWKILAGLAALIAAGLTIAHKVSGALGFRL